MMNQPFSSTAFGRRSQCALGALFSMALCACPQGSGDTEQIVNATGIFEGTQANSFVSAIYETCDHGAGRATNFMFLGQDPGLCEKLVARQSIEGNVVAYGETGHPWEEHYRAEKTGDELRQALLKGSPNGIEGSIALSSQGHKLRSIGGDIRHSFLMWSWGREKMKDDSEARFKGKVTNTDSAGDKSEIEFRARRCPGLAGFAMEWLSGTR